MVFTLANVRHGAKVFLESDRKRYIKESLYIEKNYIWDDEHWNDIDHYYISKCNDLFIVSECICGEILEIESDLTPEQVVVIIKKLCGSNTICIR